MRKPTRISVFAGQFDSQPLVFAYLIDTFGPDMNLDYVEVICRRDPAAPLRHVLDHKDACAVEDAMGLHDTCVMIFESASERLPCHGTDRLLHLATFTGHRNVPDTL